MNRVKVIFQKKLSVFNRFFFSSPEAGESPLSNGKGEKDEETEEGTTEEGTTEEEGEDGVYEIEEILDYVNESHGAGEMYYVKWKDWSEDFNTWEPAENVTTCFDVLYR